MSQKTWVFHNIQSGNERGSPNSSVGITTISRDGRLRNLNSSPGSDMILLSDSQRPDRLWGPTPPPSSGYSRAFSGLERPGREADRSRQYTTRFKNAWKNTTTLLYVFMAWCLTTYRNISYFYQPLHNSCFYFCTFRLPVVAIIRESPFTDMRSVYCVNEW